MMKSVPITTMISDKFYHAKILAYINRGSEFNNKTFYLTQILHKVL